MKKLYLATLACLPILTAFAQKPAIDSTQRKPYRDTIRIGSILIIKKSSQSPSDSNHVIVTKAGPRNSRVTTNFGVLDLGFANWSDQTDYASTGNYLVNRPGYPALGAPDFKLRTGKSLNVNIWFFMQKLRLEKRGHVNLKYGLGLELNNYRFRSPISFKENGLVAYSAGVQTNTPYIFRDSVSFNKNKLAADYLTVPLEINFAAGNGKGKQGFGLSLGVSAGYLYGERNKQVSDARGKEKNKGDYDLERFKFSYIAELAAGPVRLYGSYAPKSIFEHSLDLRPFTVGVRFSNW